MFGRLYKQRACLQISRIFKFHYASKYQSNPCISLDNPWGFQEEEAPKFQDNRYMTVAWLSALHIGRLYPQKIFLVLTSIRGLVEPRAVVRREGFCQLQTPKTPLEIEPAKFRLVQQLTKLKFHISVFVRVTDL
jgi:hypothetical protein